MTDQTTIPPGAALVERIGWDDDGRFTALLVFPNGAPDFTASLVYQQIPVRLVISGAGLKHG